MRDLEIGKIKGHWHRAQLVKSGINIGCGATDTDKDHALKYPHQRFKKSVFRWVKFGTHFTRQVQRNQNRLTLVEATLDVIAQKGFSGTSVSAIIEPASLSRGMIHPHFGGKDNLVEKAARHSSEVDLSGLDSALAQSGNSQQAWIAAIPIPATISCACRC